MTPLPEASPLLTDRTTIETDWECGQKRWWYKEEGGTGIVPKEEAIWFRQGRDYHADFADIALAAEPELLAKEMIACFEGKIRETTDAICQEELCRRAGWIAANAIYLEPATRKDYRTLLVEHELVLDRSPLWVAVTPDRVLERISDSKVIVRDYKGVGGWGISKSWLDQWPYAIQMQTLIAAVAEELEKPVGFAQVVGLSKGQEKFGRLNHPYVWASFSFAKSEWVPAGEGTGRKDLTPRPVWEYPDGILAWVRKLGPEVASAQFGFSPPIYLNERLLGDLITSRTRREREVKVFRKQATEDPKAKAIHFEPRFSRCKPPIGSPCPYLAACHNATVNTDPIGSGLYVARTPHHDLERIEKGEGNDF